MSDTGAASAADPRFPIGKFAWPESVTRDEVMRGIEAIAALPAQFRDAVSGLSEEQLDTPYREGGWTLRQLAHHVPDSHMNCYVRFKLALTEDEPTIKPYDEAAWAALPDARTGATEPCLRLLESLHECWVTLMRGMTDSDWKRRFVHPERGPMPLDTTVALYAWHCRHHLAHATNLRKSRGW